MNMRLLLSAAIALLLVAGAFLYVRNVSHSVSFVAQQTNSYGTSTEAQTIPPHDSGVTLQDTVWYPGYYSADKSTWAIYTNSAYGFSFKYPANLEISDASTSASTAVGDKTAYITFTAVSLDLNPPVPVYGFSMQATSLKSSSLEEWISKEDLTSGTSDIPYPATEEYTDPNFEGGYAKPLTFEGLPAEEFGVNCSALHGGSSDVADILYVFKNGIGYQFALAFDCQNASMQRLYQDILSTVTFS